MEPVASRPTAPKTGGLLCLLDGDRAGVCHRLHSVQHDRVAGQFGVNHTANSSQRYTELIAKIFLELGAQLLPNEREQLSFSVEEKY